MVCILYPGGKRGRGLSARLPTAHQQVGVVGDVRAGRRAAGSGLRRGVPGLAAGSGQHLQQAGQHGVLRRLLVEGAGLGRAEEMRSGRPGGCGTAGGGPARRSPGPAWGCRAGRCPARGAGRGRAATASASRCLRGQRGGVGRPPARRTPPPAARPYLYREGKVHRSPSSTPVKISGATVTLGITQPATERRFCTAR